MTIADKIFGAGGLPPMVRYIATWAGMAASLLFTASVWFVPEEDWESPAGPWAISLMGLALFVFSLWGNRYFRRQLTEAPTQEPPASR